MPRPTEAAHTCNGCVHLALPPGITCDGCVNNSEYKLDPAYPGPGRWRRDGENLDTLTLGPGVTGARSVMVTNHAHYYVTNGEVTFC